jgi:hypothetical protein
MRLDRRHLLLGTVGALAAGPALAHHGWSGYDANTVLTLTGPVCVLAPLSRMTARGLPDGSIEVGETVTVVGYPHRGESSEMRAERITVKGQTVELR